MMCITTRFALPLLAGTLAGAVAGLLGAQVIAAILYQVSVSDTTTFITAVGGVALGGVAVVVAIAWRGVRVDPAQLLRGL